LAALFDFLRVSIDDRAAIDCQQWAADKKAKHQESIPDYQQIYSRMKQISING
jgi:hypothetical protein